MDWRNILALAVLAAPLAWCTAVTENDKRRVRAELQIACISAGGSWTNSWGGECTMKGGEQ